MKNIILIFGLVSIGFISEVNASHSNTVFKCETKKCPECQLLVDVQKQTAEFTTEDSSYIMNQTDKSDLHRIFEISDSSDVIRKEYKFTFNRKNKTASLVESTDGTENTLYKNIKCFHTDSEMTDLNKLKSSVVN